MKLTDHTPENTPYTRSGLPTINFGASAIRISAHAVKLLELTAEDGIKLSNDEEQPEDWFLSKDPKGFKLKSGKGREKGLLFYNNGLRTKLFTSLNCKLETFSFVISDEAVELGTGKNKTKYFPIITARAVNQPKP